MADNDWSYRIEALSNAKVSEDGEMVSFELKIKDGASIPLACPFSQLPDVIGFIGTLAKMAGDCRDVPVPTPPAAYNDLVPIPATAIGFQVGPTPDETFLIVRLATLDLAFAVPSSELARLGPDIARTGLTLS